MSEWKQSNLLKHVNLITKGTTPTSIGRGFTEHGVKFIKVESISEDGRFVFEKIAFIDEVTNLMLQRSQLRENDILFSIAGVLGRIAIVPGDILPANTNQALALIRLSENPRLLHDYLKFYLKSEFVKKQIERISVQLAQANFSLRDIGRLVIQFPSFLPEQRKIARILSTVDVVIEKTEAAIAKYEAIKKGMMADLFTRGIDVATGKLRPRYEDAPELYKETELGWVPKEWEVPRIGDLAVYVGSGVTPTGGSEVYKNEGILFIRSQNVHFEGLYLNDVAFLSPATHENMQRSTVLPNDVLLNITGASIGRCCYFPAKLFEANVNQHVCIIRVEKSCESKAIYLSQVLSSYIGQVQISKLNAGGNREGLNYKQLRAFFVPWPRENKEIEQTANMLRSINAMIEKEKVTLHKSHLIKQGLMADLLTGRVRVQVAAEMAEVANG